MKSAVIVTIFRPVVRPEPKFKGWIIEQEILPQTTRYTERDAAGKIRWRAVSSAKIKNKHRTISQRIDSAWHSPIA